jgi:protein-tyrosine phosphatase
VIDLHCHVIPGVDDGPATIKDSLALCRAAVAAGTTRIIATPHVNWDYPAVDANTVHGGIAALNAALREASIELAVDAGAEIAVSRIGEMSDAEISLLRLGDGPYSLIECPHHGGAPTAIQEMLLRFARSGHSIQTGMLCCITARSLTGDFGSRARAYAWDLMASGQVHAIASDGHDALRRPPDLASTLDRAGLSDAQIGYFACSSPEAIINGARVPKPPPVVPKPSRRWPLRRQSLRPR